MNMLDTGRQVSPQAAALQSHFHALGTSPLVAEYAGTDLKFRRGTREEKAEPEHGT